MLGGLWVLRLRWASCAVGGCAAGTAQPHRTAVGSMLRAPGRCSARPPSHTSFSASPTPSQYVFSFSYDDEGGARMVTGGSSKQCFGAKVGAGSWAGWGVLGSLCLLITSRPAMPSQFTWRCTQSRLFISCMPALLQ